MPIRFEQSPLEQSPLEQSPPDERTAIRRQASDGRLSAAAEAALPLLAAAADPAPAPLLPGQVAPSRQEGGAQETSVEPAAIPANAPMSPVAPGRSASEWRHATAFAALKSDGAVITWGDAFSGGDSSLVSEPLAADVTEIFATSSAFAALKSDGSVVTWGSSFGGGDSSAVAADLASGISGIASNRFAFAALKSDGAVITWGNSFTGGDRSAVAKQLRSGVTRIFASDSAFAALKRNGSLITWGVLDYGEDETAAVPVRGVAEVVATSHAFAALKRNGSVVTLGASFAGGDSSTVARDLASGVVRIAASERAFAALKVDGSVITWGDGFSGGDSAAVAANLQSGVMEIIPSTSAFAALKDDGSVITWGYQFGGGDSSSVASDLSSGVTTIWSTNNAFAALKSDGSLITWGDSSSGGDSSAVADQLGSDVTEVVAAGAAFAALKRNGSVVTWGAPLQGGDSSAVAAQLGSDVRRIVANDHAFAALKNDGSIITWGDGFQGGNSSEVAAQLSSDVVGFADPFSADRLPPQPLNEITVAGRQLLLRFARPIVTTGLSTSQFTATVIGAERSERAITVITTDPDDPSLLSLTLAGVAPRSDQTLQLRYRDLTPNDDDSGVIQDAAGNDLASFDQAGRNADRFSSAVDVAFLAATYADLELTHTARRATGNASNNRIRVDQPTAVNNVLIGGQGLDSLDGGEGADLYLIREGSEHRAAEIRDSGLQGQDECRLESRVPGDLLTLFAGDTGLERVTLGGGAGAQPDTTGAIALHLNAFAAPAPLIIRGHAGVNRIVGTAFADTIDGGEGGDVYLVYDGSHADGDEIRDTGTRGSDRILFASSIPGDTLTLSARQSGVEQVRIDSRPDDFSDVPQNINATAASHALSIRGNNSINTLIGTAFADAIRGGAAGDTLLAGSGDDRLHGDGGNDILTGGRGADWFRFDAGLDSLSNRDVITDFMPHRGDRIDLASAIFTALKPSDALPAAAFHIGATATSRQQHILYNDATGLLLYDGNGSRPGAATPIAVLPAGLAPLISADAFLVS